MKRQKTANAPVAQLDRVFGYEPKGRGFVKEPFSSESGSFSNFLWHLRERQFFLGVYLVFTAFQAGACVPAFFVPFFRIGFRISSRVSAAAASALWIA